MFQKVKWAFKLLPSMASVWQYLLWPAYFGYVVHIIPCLEELKSVEGTVLMHSVYAISHNKEIASALIKIFEGRITPLTPFNMCMLLSVASLDRYNSKCIDLLIRKLGTQFLFAGNSNVVPWFPEMSTGSTMVADIDRLLLEVISRSQEWTSAIAPLIDLATACLEKKKGLTAIGQLILVNCFHRIEAVRERVLDLL